MTSELLAHYREFFGSLAEDIILDDKKRDDIFAIGIDVTRWPECEAKAMVGEFLNIAKTEGPVHARIKISHRMEFREFPYKFDMSELKAANDEFIKYGVGIDTIQALKKNPADVFKIAFNLQKAHGNGIKFHKFSECIGPAMEAIRADVEEDKAMISIPGWPNLSQKIGGFNPGRVSLISAATGGGKTLLSLNLALAATEIMPVCFFNMEMLIKDLTARTISSETGTSSTDLMSGKVEKSAVDGMIRKYRNQCNLFITGGSALTIDAISSSIRRYAENEGVKLFFVDYDQKLKTMWRDEEWRILQRCVEEFEELAKETESHVILLAQADDYGDPKASKRAKQPASCLMHFTEENGQKFIKLTKNRFGKTGEKIYVDFCGEKAQVQEATMQKMSQTRSLST